MKNKTLNKQQKEAVTTSGPVLIRAGAGSGKTTVLVNRVVHLIEEGANPFSILLLTFTNRAADEMRERARKMTPKSKNVTACTYHSFCWKIIRNNLKYLNVADLQIISEQETEDLYRSIIAELEFDELSHFPKTKDVISTISFTKNCQISYQEACERMNLEQDWSNELKQIEEMAQNYKKQHFLISFDDILTTTVYLLEHYDIIRKNIIDRYHYILVDEYQDTNPLQEKILLLLKNNKTEISVVGDDAQSIYAFNGATVSNILNFPQRFDRVTTIDLIQNYRSTQEIISFSNALINNNTLECVPKHMISAPNRHGPRPKLWKCEGSNTAPIITDIIEDRCHSDEDLNDCAILYRSSRSSFLIEKELVEQGIPYKKFGGMNFLDLSYIADTLSFLRIVNNPRDSIAWQRVLQCYYGVGIKTAKSLSDLITADSDPDIKKLISNHIRPSLKADMQSLYKHYLQWELMLFPEIVANIIQYYLLLREKNLLRKSLSDKWEEAEELLIEHAKEDLPVLEEMSLAYSTLSAFLNSFILNNEDPRNGDLKDYITLSTIHSAKGKEWETVIVADVGEGLFPRTSIGDITDSEELRCFYVAVTRAKTYLYMLMPEKLKSWNKEVYIEPPHYVQHDDIWNKMISLDEND